MPRQCTVTLSLENQSAYVENLSERLIDDILGCDARIFAQAPNGTITFGIGRVRPWEPRPGSQSSLYTNAEDDQLRIPRGLAGRLVVGLKDLGIPYKVEAGPYCCVKPLAFDNTVLAELAEDERERFKAIVEQSTGWIEYRKGKERVKMMANLAQYYSKANVLILTKGRRTAKSLAKELSDLLGERVTYGVKKNWSKKSRVHVSCSSVCSVRTPMSRRS